MKLIHRIALLACLLLAAPAFADLLAKPKELETFLLRDHAGNAVTQATLAGKPTLVFFGFTRCPDICPSAMAVLHEVKRQMPEVNLLFVSIDPADGPEQLKGYADTFGAIAARGFDTVVLLHQLGIHRHDPKASLASHPTAVFMLDRQGRYVGFQRYPQDAKKIVAELQKVR